MSAFSRKHLALGNLLLLFSLGLEGGVVIQVESFAFHVGMGVLFIVLRGRTVVGEWHSFFIKIVFLDELFDQIAVDLSALFDPGGLDLSVENQTFVFCHTNLSDLIVLGQLTLVSFWSRLNDSCFRIPLDV